MCGRPRLADSRTAQEPGPATGCTATIDRCTVALAAPSSPKYTFTTSPETETVR
ncbi:MULTISPECIES: hypothetical protein [unclassified Streptomyces]|uniref:hypothetical protein n=1 Tax=unclassified Streptomyces TaxID=2593676 RepID=UPI00403D3D2E